MDRPKHYTELQVQTVCLVVVTAFTIGFGLYLLRPVLVPFMLAVFLAFILTPVLDLQTKWLRIPRLLALFITLLVTVAGLSILTGITVTSITQLANNANELQDTLEDRVREAVDKLPLERFGIETVKQDRTAIETPPRRFDLAYPDPLQVDPPPPQLDAESGESLQSDADTTEAAPSVDQPEDAPLEPPLPGDMAGAQDELGSAGDETGEMESGERELFDPMSLFPEDLLNWILTRLTGVLTTFASQAVLVLLFVIFLLIGRPAQPRPSGSVAFEIERSVKRYIITKVVVSALTGVLVFATLNILNIPFAMAFGALAFMLNFIPSIGSIVATLLPVPVLLLMDIPITTAWLAVIIPGAIQFTIGNLIEPKVMGDSLDLHPVVVLAALIFWGMIWGPIGMLLAAPLTAITKIVLSKIELTQPMADALAGRVGGLLEFR